MSSIPRSHRGKGCPGFDSGSAAPADVTSDADKMQRRRAANLRGFSERMTEAADPRESQFLDADIPELHEARSGDPFAVGLLAAVVLERELARSGHAGELRVLDDGLSVELHGQPVALHRNHKRIPFTDGVV